MTPELIGNSSIVGTNVLDRGATAIAASAGNYAKVELFMSGKSLEERGSAATEGVRLKSTDFGCEVLAGGG
jgi:hypothetical protein